MTSGSSAVPFFLLPRELRDQIYHILWSNSLIAFRHNSVVTLARYYIGSDYTILNAIPAWLEANRQICDEGMHQFYRHAYFTVGEYHTLPLYLYRDLANGLTISTQPDQTRASRENAQTYTTSIIKNVRSYLLSLKRAQTLIIQDLCVKLEAYYRSRENCGDAARLYCACRCCDLQMDVSIGPNDGYTESHTVFEKFHVIAQLLHDNDIALEELQIDIVSSQPRLKGVRPNSGFSKFIRTEGRDVNVDIQYDWSFFDTLPTSLKRINIGVLEDTMTPRALYSPSFGIIALEVAREKCRDVVPGLVELEDKDGEQTVHVKSCSYIRKGKPLWVYKLRSGRMEDTRTCSRKEYLCSRHDARSPKVHQVEIEDTDSIIERPNVGHFVMLEHQTSRTMVLRRRHG
jgi:hypothetical protein